MDPDFADFFTNIFLLALTVISHFFNFGFIDLSIQLSIFNLFYVSLHIKKIS